MPCELDYISRAKGVLLEHGVIHILITIGIMLKPDIRKSTKTQLEKRTMDRRRMSRTSMLS